MKYYSVTVSYHYPRSLFPLDSGSDSTIPFESTQRRIRLAIYPCEGLQIHRYIDSLSLYGLCIPGFGILLFMMMTMIVMTKEQAIRLS